VTGWVVASNGGAQISFAAIGTPLAFKQPDPNRAWLPVPALPGLPEAFIGTTAVQCGGSADHGAVLAVGATPPQAYAAAHVQSVIGNQIATNDS